MAGTHMRVEQDLERQRILGIDPGLNRTGYAILMGNAGVVRLIEGGVIRSTQTKTLAERIHEIGSEIRAVIEETAPAAVAIEQVFSLGKNPKTAVLLAHARGAILYAVAEARLPVTHYTPRQIKKLLTGSGTAGKSQVQRAVQRELSLPHLLEPNDVADAFAVALSHYHSHRVGLMEPRDLAG